MTKDELMKFANDPFWVRLRTVLFVLFWLLWVAMLAGAIYIIVDAPKCAAPTPKKWWEQGIFAKIKANELDVIGGDIKIADIKKTFATGIIYELNSDDTYRLDSKDVESRIKDLVDHLKANHMHLILDITPNYAHKDSALFQDALNGDEKKRGAFVWAHQPANNIPTTWKRIESNVSAWEKVADQHYVLSQYGDGRYDLQFKDEVAVNALKQSLIKLIEWGAKGFRLANAKHLMIGELADEEANPMNGAEGHTQYNGQLHVYTTYIEGIDGVLETMRSVVRNYTQNEGFLSVSDIITRPEFFGAKQQNDSFIIDLPKLGRLTSLLAHSQNVDLIHKDLFVNNYTSSWFQWDLETSFDNIGISEYIMFIIGLKGVPITRLGLYDQLLNESAGTELIKNLENIRGSPSFMHGTYDIHHNNYTVGYTR